MKDANLTNTHKYKVLSPELIRRIEEDKLAHVKNKYAFDDADIIRRDMSRDKASVWRKAFVRDVEKIMHCPYYNRYADKTQVFSFYKNDDITRRALHVQLVSRIARNIGEVLGLNVDLIEAIALGHDIGHTPFGHAGERFLNEIYHDRTGRYFNHNVHSVRVLDKIFPRNISLQVLDGVLCHNGELELKEYRPANSMDFEGFDMKLEVCYVRNGAIKELVPVTLEGCVVRISDILAYIGKDRQDAKLANILENDECFTDSGAGVINAQLINNFTVNIIENSYGKPYIKMDDEYFEGLKTAKRENYQYIYKNEGVDKTYNDIVRPMFCDMYEKLAEDVSRKKSDSIIYKHHIEYLMKQRAYYTKAEEYINNSVDDIVCDYIASMTDDYFIDLYGKMFPESPYKVEYISYFEEK